MKSKIKIINMNNDKKNIEKLLQNERLLKKEIESLKIELKLIHLSKHWIFIKNFIKIENNLQIIKKIISYPNRIIKNLSLKNIKKFIISIKNNGIELTLKKILYYIQIQKEITNINKNKNKKNSNEILPKISDFKKLTFPKHENPKISIIIPVYNQINYTYNCLKSILENTSETIEYEIILANDCSTDITTEIEKFVENIKIINNEKNLKFLLNCNNATKYAKGKHLHFLNNDTEIQKNCIESLLETIENNEDIGIVGSKLLYPNGNLQEAGAIVWNNGSISNYGKFKNPQDSEFNYIKEVDYISGASIIIRKKIWDEIGGFDEIFIPAYSEDCDLAFQVRELGYKVVYQPKSVIIHYENISQTQTQKLAVNINQKNFYKKWATILKTQHCSKTKENLKKYNNIFLARDRSLSKTTILIINNFPQNNDDIFLKNIKFLKDKNFNIKFICNDLQFENKNPYINVFQQLGIEVLYGEKYKNNWLNWLKNNSKFIEKIFINNDSNIESLKNSNFKNIKIIQLNLNENISQKID